MLHRLLAVTAVALGLTFAGSAFAAQKITVSIQPGNGDPMAVAAQKDFKEFIETKTNGKYSVEVFVGGAFGNCDTVFQGVQFGTINIALDSTSNLSQFAPELSVFDMPFLMPNESAMRKITEGPAGQTIMSYLEKKGVHPVSLVLCTPRAIVSTVPFKSPKDIHGQKMRSTPSKTHMAAISSLGFSATPIAWSEVLTGLQQGVITATDTEYLGILNWRLCDVAKYVLLTDYIPVVWVMYCSQDWYDSLPAEDRAIFDEAFRLYYNATQRYVKEGVDRTFDTIQKDYGVTITRLSDADKAEFIERSKGAYDVLTEEQKKLVDVIRAELLK